MESPRIEEQIRESQVPKVIEFLDRIDASVNPEKYKILDRTETLRDGLINKVEEEYKRNNTKI